MPRGNPTRPTPERLKKRNAAEPATCSNPACNAPLNGLHYFCRPCWFRAPAKERVALFGMHKRAEPVASKVEKIVRILAAEDAEKQTAPTS